MSPWQQLIEKTVPDQSAPWPEPVKVNGGGMNAPTERKLKPKISVDEWIATLPRNESYQTWRGTHQ
jgi:hypothetical protein